MISRKCRRSSSASLAISLVVGLTALLSVACGGGGEESIPDLTEEARSRPDAPIVVAAGAPIVIGISAPLTGPDADAGQEDRDAILTAIKRWKAANGPLLQGHEIAVRVEDDGCTDADITVQAAERLLRQPGLVGVMGPNCSTGAFASIPLYRQGGIVTISGSATRTDLTEGRPSQGRFFFRTAYRNDLEGLLIALATAETFDNISLVDDGESYGQDLADFAARLLDENGISVARETVERGAVEYTDLAEKITRDNPDVVAFAGFNPEAALFYEQLRDAGYEGPFGAGDAAASIPNFVELVGEEAEGVVFAGCSLELPEDFRADFEEIHGGEPGASAFVAQYADAATVLLDAIAATAEAQPDGSLSIDPEELRDSVAAADLPDGLSGPVAFDADGDRVPAPGDELEQVVADAAAAEDAAVFQKLGLVPCFVQDGQLVNSPAGQS